MAKPTIEEVITALEYLLNKDSDPNISPPNFPFSDETKELIGLLKTAEQYPLGTLSTDITNAKSDITTLQVDVTNAKNDITTLQTDVTNTKSDIATLQTDVTNAKSDIATLQTDIANAKSDLDVIKKTITDLFPKPRVITTKGLKKAPYLDKILLRTRR